MIKNPEFRRQNSELGIAHGRPNAALGRNQILSTKFEILNKFKLPKLEFQNKRQHLIATMVMKA